MSWTLVRTRDPLCRAAAWAALSLTAFSSGAEARDACAQRPEYQRLRQSLKYTSGDKTMAGLEDYATWRPNLSRCEAADIDRRLGILEQGLFAYASNTRRVDAQTVLRCNEIDPVTARCTGPVDDATGRTAGARSKALRARPAGPVLLVTTRRRTTLQSVYATTLDQALAGQPGAALPFVNGRVSLPGLAEAPAGLVLIGIYQTDGPWRYRKAVWYF